MKRWEPKPLDQYPSWITQLFEIFADNYIFFSEKIDDDLSKHIKYMTWYNILESYTTIQIFEVLEDVLRRFKTRVPAAAEYEEVIIEKLRQTKKCFEINKTAETQEESIKKFKEKMTSYGVMVDDNCKIISKDNNEY